LIRSGFAELSMRVLHGISPRPGITPVCAVAAADRDDNATNVTKTAVRGFIGLIAVRITLYFPGDSHEAVNLPFDSITEVKKVTDADLRHPVDAPTVKAAA